MKIRQYLYFIKVSFLASMFLVLHTKWREHATSVCESVRWIGEVSSRIRWSSFSQCFHHELFLLCTVRSVGRWVEA